MYLRIIFSIMFNWYHRCILRKYCKSDIFREISQSKSIQKKVSVHMRAPKYFQTFAIARIKV